MGSGWFLSRSAGLMAWRTSRALAIQLALSFDSLVELMQHGIRMARRVTSLKASRETASARESGAPRSSRLVARRPCRNYHELKVLLGATEGARMAACFEG